MPTSFGVADVTGKHSYVLNFIENNPLDRLIKLSYRTDHIIEFEKPIL